MSEKVTINEEILLKRKEILEKEIEIGLKLINQAQQLIQEKSVAIEQIRGAIMLIDEFLKKEEKNIENA